LSAVFILGAALVAPLLGFLLLAPVSRRLHRVRRYLGLFWHFLTVCCWSELALRAGHPPGHGEGWDVSHVVFTFAAGLFYTETLFLLGLRGRRGNARSRPATSPSLSEALAVAPEREEEPRLDEMGEAGDEPHAEEETIALGQEAAALLGRMQGLESVPVDAIMTPRSELFHLDDTMPARAALDWMRQTGQTRVLVVEGGSLDRILGVAHAKDLVPIAAETDPREPVRRHVRRWLRVAQGESSSHLLEGFRRSRLHVAVVSDPLGRTMGLVTLADVFRSIAGVTELPGAAEIEQ
jgi:hypothetical protein